MESTTKPVFYSTNPSRWKRFLWVVKIVSVLFMIGIACILFSLLHKQVFRLPSLHEHLMATQSENLKFNRADLQAAENLQFKKLAQQAKTLKEHNFYKRDKIILGEVKKISSSTRRILRKLGHPVEIFARSECFQNEYDFARMVVCARYCRCGCY